MLERDQIKAAPSQFQGLQAARCFAAMAIIMLHLRYVGGIDLPAWINHFDLLAIGVPLFYILSAFVLTAKYHDKLTTSEQIAKYFSRRFFRIAPLFYAMIVVTVLTSSLLDHQQIDVIGIVFSVLFVFNLVPQYVQGLVAASWSVGIEMLFYATLPSLFLVTRGAWSSLAALIISVILAAFWLGAFVGTQPPLSLFGNYSLISYGYYFVMGTLGYHLWRFLPKQWLLGVALLMTSPLILVAANSSLNTAVVYFLGPRIGWEFGPIVARVLYGIALSLFVLGIAIAPLRPLVNRVTLALGNASFSLYLWHPVIIQLLRRAGLYELIESWVHDEIASFAISFVVSFAIISAVAFLTFRFIERPGQALGESLWARRFALRPVSTAKTELDYRLARQSEPTEVDATATPVAGFDT